MLRLRFSQLKGLLYALGVLLATFSALEVGLRIESATREIAKPSGSPPLTTRSWTTHHALRPGVHPEIAGPSGTTIPLRINSFGVRGVEPSVPKPENLLRIIYLGDEFILESERMEEETICGRLERMLKEKLRIPVEVINAGVPEFTPLLSYLQLRHSLMTLNPDLVLVNVDPSDLPESRQYLRHTLIDPQEGPLACPHPDLITPAPPNTVRRICQELRILDWASDQIGSWLTGGESEQLLPVSISGVGRSSQIQQLDRTLAPLAYTLRLIRNSGSRLIVTLSPQHLNEQWQSDSRLIQQRLHSNRFHVFVPPYDPDTPDLRVSRNFRRSAEKSDFPRHLVSYLDLHPELLRTVRAIKTQRSEIRRN